MAKIFRILFFLHLPAFVLGMEVYASSSDSLKMLLATATPTEAADIYLQLAASPDIYYVTEAIDYAEKAYSIGDRNNDSEIKGKSLLLLGQLTNRMAKGTAAIEYYERSLPFLFDLADSASIYSAYSEMGVIHTNKADYKSAFTDFTNAKSYVDTMYDKSKLAFLAKSFGNIHQSVGDYQKALENFEHSLLLAKELRDSVQMALAIGSIGNVYLDWHMYENAIDCFTQALELLEGTTNQRGKGIAYVNMADALDRMMLYDSALSVAKKSADIFIKNNLTEDIPDALIQVAHSYISLRNFSEAESTLAKALSIARTIELNSQMGMIYFCYGSLHNAQGDLNGAISYVKKSIIFFDLTEDKKDNIEAYQMLSGLLETAGNYQDALKYYRMYRELTDSLYTENSIITILELKSRYELDSKNNQIMALNAEYSKNRTTIILTSVVALILLVGGIFVYRLYTTARRSKVQLEESNATKDKFFSIIAHDLRNPIGALISASSLLTNEDYCTNKEEVKEFANDIHSSAKHVSNLLEDLLTWARTQQGRVAYNPTEADLSQIADNIVDTLGTHARNKGIRLVNEITNEMNAFCDVNLTATILRNIVSNAIKFTPQDGNVTISAESDGKMIFVSVTDTGVGIPKSAIPHLFKVGATRSTTGTADETGTGLGLIICKEFSERNGGSISVVSEPGVGTKFTFTVPVSDS